MIITRFIFVVLLSLPAFVVASEYQAKIVSVYDGDTATALTADNKQVKIRFDQIDTPERQQPFGNAARQALADKIFGKVVTIKVNDVDRYGRTVAEVFLGDRNINLEMVSDGFAWAYLAYVRDKRYIRAEASAREAKRGLWALQADQIMAPWEWRRAQRNASVSPRPSAQPAAISADAFSCGTKRYCSQMTSCEEARFHLTQCGLSRLDSDGDGVPCEAICR